MRDRRRYLQYVRKDLSEVWRPQGITVVIEFKLTCFWQAPPPGDRHGWGSSEWKTEWPPWFYSPVAVIGHCRHLQAAVTEAGREAQWGTSYHLHPRGGADAWSRRLVCTCCSLPPPPLCPCTPPSLFLLPGKHAHPHWFCSPHEPPWRAN